MRLPAILSLIAVAVLGLAGAFVWVRSHPATGHAAQEFLFASRFSKYDDLIAQAAARHGVSPSLVKAIIWRESRFQPAKSGAHGERGLMQVTEPAATDWVRAENIQVFVPADLFDPKTNIDVGTWYLARALRHWSAKDDPVPFALAEYNAGRTRVKRWEQNSHEAGNPSAEGLREAMDFPSTRQYIASILERYRTYLARGEFGENPASPPLTKPAEAD